MRTDGVDEAHVSEEHGGLSPAALRIEISPDMIGLWRLRKSLSLDDARWYLDHGRKDLATAAVRGARFCHHEILRIRWHLRNRADKRAAHPERPTARAIEVPSLAPPEPKCHDAIVSLQPRHREYVTLLAQGFDRATIAKMMGLCHGTVAVYHSLASSALGVKSRELQEHAIHNGWGSPASLTATAAPPSAVLTPPIAHGSAAVLPGETRA